MITINNIPLKEASIFPGGEVHIRLSPELEHTNISNLYVRAKIRSSDDLMELILTKDALDFYYPNSSKTLELLYFPYARQDRRCKPGEAWSLKPFIKIIDDLKFTSILTADLHSPVVATFIRTPMAEISVRDIFMKSKKPRYDYEFRKYTMVAPDIGATNRAKSISEYFGCELLVADKVRNDQGQISYDAWWNNFQSQKDSTLTNKHLLIIDDICDGGATFIELAKKLSTSNPASLGLYVTHGIFSKGIDVLFEAGFDFVITTNSITQLSSITERLEIWSIT